MIDRDSLIQNLNAHFKAIKAIEEDLDSGFVYQPASIDILGALFLIASLEAEIRFLEAAMGAVPKTYRLTNG